MTLHRTGNLLLLALFVTLSLLTLGCGGFTKADAPASQPPPPSVAVIEASAQDVPIFADYAAQTFARAGALQFEMAANSALSSTFASNLASEILNGIKISTRDSALNAHSSLDRKLVEDLLKNDS